MAIAWNQPPIVSEAGAATVPDAAGPPNLTMSTRLGRNVEIAAYPGAEIGGRGRGLTTQQRLDREFLRIRVGFHDRGLDLHLRIPRLRGKDTADHHHHIHTQDPQTG